MTPFAPAGVADRGAASERPLWLSYRPVARPVTGVGRRRVWSAHTTHRRIR
jgi:hypothetical protein